MQIDLEYDIVIVGAGPAGAGTALFLAKAGIPHLIIDKSGFPRDKICGDGLSGKVVGLLNEINPQLVNEMATRPDIFLPSWGVSFIAPNGKGIDLPFKNDMSTLAHAPGFTSRRMEFDNFLVNQLDSKFSTLMTETRLLKIERTAEGLLLHLEQKGKPTLCRAKAVVGAGGTQCPVARTFGSIDVQDSHMFAGLRCYYENVGNMHPQNFIELFFIREALPGYLWIFPLPNNQANVGIGILSRDIKKHKLNLRQVLESAIKNNIPLRERFSQARLISKPGGWRLPLGTRKRPLSGERFILLGDAGALIDPFTGEGIGNALLSGKFAAKTLKNALDTDDFSADFLAGYDRALYDSLWSELHISYRIQQLVRVPWLFNFVINRVLSNQALKETFSAMFNDVDLRAKLSSPAFYLKMFKKH